MLEVDVRPAPTTPASATSKASTAAATKSATAAAAKSPAATAKCGSLSAAREPRCAGATGRGSEIACARAAPMRHTTGRIAPVCRHPSGYAPGDCQPFCRRPPACCARRGRRVERDRLRSDGWRRRPIACRVPARPLIGVAEPLLQVCIVVARALSMRRIVLPVLDTGAAIDVDGSAAPVDAAAAPVSAAAPVAAGRPSSERVGSRRTRRRSR